MNHPRGDQNMHFHHSPLVLYYEYGTVIRYQVDTRYRYTFITVPVQYYTMYLVQVLYCTCTGST